MLRGEVRRVYIDREDHPASLGTIYLHPYVKSALSYPSLLMISSSLRSVSMTSLVSTVGLLYKDGRI